MLFFYLFIVMAVAEIFFFSGGNEKKKNAIGKDDLIYLDRGHDLIKMNSNLGFKKIIIKKKGRIIHSSLTTANKHLTEILQLRFFLKQRNKDKNRGTEGKPATQKNITFEVEQHLRFERKKNLKLSLTCAVNKVRCF